LGGGRRLCCSASWGDGPAVLKRGQMKKKSKNGNGELSAGQYSLHFKGKGVVFRKGRLTLKEMALEGGGVYCHFGGKLGGDWADR